jgi:hypothetical protein
MKTPADSGGRSTPRRMRAGWTGAMAFALAAG